MYVWKPIRYQEGTIAVIVLIKAVLLNVEDTGLTVWFLRRETRGRKETTRSAPALQWGRQNAAVLNRRSRVKLQRRGTTTRTANSCVLDVSNHSNC